MTQSDVTGSDHADRPDESHLFEMQAVPPTREYLQRMWDKRDFSAALPVEELRASHQATLLGNVWHLANPIMSVIVYYLIFGIILGVSRGIENYTLFLVVGVFAYRQTGSCVIGGARSISSNTGLMRAIRFPRAILPLSTVISNLMTFGFELTIVAGVAVVTGEGVSRRWLVLPFIVLVHTVLNLGLAFITARLNDMFRDVQQILPFIMQLGRYASGVMFTLQDRMADAPGWMHVIIKWNPLITVLDLYRWAFMGSPVALDDIVRLVGISVVSLLFGFRFFVAAESRYGRG